MSEQAKASQSRTGHFVWHDLMSHDPAASRRFHTELFGWKTQDVDMGPMGNYVLLLNNEKDFAGIMPFDKKHGMPSHWMPYLGVENVDASVKRITSLGGKVAVPGTDIPNVGRFAVIADPQGAHVSVFTYGREVEPKAAPKPGEKPAPGTFCWEELHTSDVEGARKFYAEVAGWTDQGMDMGPAGTYFVQKRGEAMVAGMMTKSPEMKGPPFWLSYIAVASADDTVARARRLGATVFVPPTDIPNVGRFAIMADPTGAAFAILQ